MPQHEVQQGDCISSIAAHYGFAWTTIWNRPENAGLKQTRKDPNILQPGDKVFVPEKELQELSLPASQRHTFEIDSEPTYLKLRFLHLGEPRKNVRWALIESEQEVASGTTDGDGNLETPINPKSPNARLRLFPKDGDPEDYDVQLGDLEPVDTITGQQQRLAQLGLYSAEIDGQESADLRDAIRHFQMIHQLTVDGVAGPQTKAALKKAHGS